MNPTPSNIRSNAAPPTTVYHTNSLPLTGEIETATSIASHGARKRPKWAMEVRSVAKAFVYMDSIFFAADVQCRLANPANLEDDRTLHEMELLARQGELRKFRPCVVMGVDREGGEKTRYRLCPMAAFHEGGSRQSYNGLEEPESLLVRPVQTTSENETFGAYSAYRFQPEWDRGPQYLFPIQVSRDEKFVTNHWLEQQIDEESFERLREDVEEVSNVWKRWRKAEHVVVGSKADIPVFKSEWDIRDWANTSPTQWKAYPSREEPRGAIARNPYLKLTNKVKFINKETDDAIPFKELTDDSTLSNTSEEDRVPLQVLDTPLVQDNHTPWRTPPPLYQGDLPATNSSRAPDYSKETPDGHPATPSHLVAAPSPGVTPLLTREDNTPTERTLQSPHDEPIRPFDDSIQERKATGALGDEPPELEAPSDMDISPMSNPERLKNLVERHSLQSSQRSNSPSPPMRDLATPKVEDKTRHPERKFLKHSANILHHDPNFVPGSGQIPVDIHTLSTRSKVELTILAEEPSNSSPWKSSRKATVSRGVKRARSPEDEPSTADLPPKRQRKTQI